MRRLVAAFLLPTNLRKFPLKKLGADKAAHSKEELQAVNRRSSFMICDLTEKISLLIDGELPAADARLVERHLLACVECQRARIDFLNLRSQMAAYEMTLSPAEQRQALANVLAKQGATIARHRPDDRRAGVVSGRRLTWGFNPGWWIAGLILVGSLLALAVYYNSQRVGGPPPQQAAVKRPETVSPAPTVEKPKSPNPAESQAVADNQQQNIATLKRPKITGPTRPVSRKHAAETLAQQNEASVIDLGPQGDSRTSGSPPIRSADAETMTAVHFEKSELLLRAFRNVRLSNDGVAAEIDYERQRAQQLIYQNIMLRREADTAGDVQVATLLESLEPILLDIANLSQHPKDEDVRAIQQRVERKNIVALLQVNSTALAGALD